MDKFNQDVLKIVVAQICQVVGFQGIFNVPMEVLVDLMQRYISKIAITTKQYAELCGRTEPCLADLNLSFKDIGVSIPDLEDYVNNVDPFPFPHQIPKLPIPRPSNMNFLKPGSKETLSRPIHIHEHLPPMYPEKEEEEANLSINDSFDEDQLGSLSSHLQSYNEKMYNDGDKHQTKRRHIHEEEGQPVREIDSVMMTTSGFISSARAGKLPEPRRPDIALPSIFQRDVSSTKKKATMEKIIRRKTQLGGIQPGPMAKPRPKESKLKPKLPGGAPPGTGSLSNASKIAPVLKMPTPKKVEDKEQDNVVTVSKEPTPEKPRSRDRRDEHRHRERRRDRDRSRDDKEKYRGRMRMRGLSKEEELRRYKQREQELIAALAASASVTVTSIPPPRLRVREKTPEKDKDGFPILTSPTDPTLVLDDNKLDVFKKLKLGEPPENPEDPSGGTMVEIQNIKEEKPDDDEFGTPHNPHLDFGHPPPPIIPPTPTVVEPPSPLPYVSPRKVEKRPRKSKPRARTKPPSGSSKTKIKTKTKTSRRHSKGSSKRRKSTPSAAPPEVPQFEHRSPEASPNMKSPPTEHLSFPNAPSHIPSFSSFSYDNFRQPPPLSEIKPYPSPYAEEPAFNSLVPPMDESVHSMVSSRGDRDEFDRSLENESSFMDQLEEPLPTITANLPKLEKKKEHKKDKKSKDRDAEKEKAKKKKKDKERAKDEKKKAKEKLKEEKRRKKKEKEEAHIPKITLKLPQEEPPRRPVEPKPTPKLVIKPVVKRPDEIDHYTSFTAKSIDPPGSPEIAKLTALITRPSKSSSKKHSSVPTVPPLKIKDAVKKSVKKEEEKKRKRKHMSESEAPHPKRIALPPPPTPFSSSAPPSPPVCVPKPPKKQSNTSSSLTTETVGPIGCFKDDKGNAVWICPTCAKQDDGSPMIGCDTCDDWYHWVCVGIQVAPNENVNWYCPRCILHQKQRSGGSGDKKKRGRKRKLT